MEKLSGEYWNDRYKNDKAGWDIGSASQPIKEYIDQLENKNIAILIPGCGNAYEAEYLLQKGFTNVTLIDFAQHAIDAVSQKLAQYLGKELKVFCSDFFNWNGNYDLIIEQTFFCAIDPLLRKYYVDKIFNNLDAGGKLVGVLFNRTFEEGPPFSGSEAEYRDLFSPLFDIISMEPCHNSISPRAGTELFVMLKRKSS